ncbi:hypothetical protein ATCC90586_010916 [Pythium insidiosum]|nr:hypothetical protein ATCC90586_010916 [Pythium insidiosum]
MAGERQAKVTNEPTHAPAPEPKVDGDLAPYYACALRPANILADGYQREMTDLELHTSFLWATGKLNLASVPKFFMETFMTDEYDELVDYHKRHLMYRLYVRLPRGFMLPRFNANRQFWNLLHKGAEATGGSRPKDTVNQLFADHYTTACEARYQMVTLTFTSQAKRNMWKNRQLPFISRNLKVQLQASDTLSTQDPLTGYDEGARELHQELDQLLAKPDDQSAWITSLDDWLRLFNGRIIDNKADGRCLYQAVDGALRQSLKVKSLGNGKFSVKEAHTLKQIACTYLFHYLPQMIDDGTVRIADLHERYFGVRDDNITDHVKYIEAVAHIWETYNFPSGAAIPPDHWSGAEEIFGLVWYLREPLFVIGADAHIQVYIVEQAEADSQYDERMVILTPTNNEAWAMIQTILNHAVLLNPYKIRVSEPALTELWSPHFIAVRCNMADQNVLVVNIYAPTARHEREAFFRLLAGSPHGHTGPVLVGGDFNCTNHPEVDRSYHRGAASHVSAGLTEWMRAWQLTDALVPFFPPEDADRDAIAEFQAAQHTVNAIDLGGTSDHAAVFMRILAHRLKPILPEVIAPSQAGFVPANFPGVLERPGNGLNIRTYNIPRDVDEAWEWDSGTGLRRLSKDPVEACEEVLPTTPR